MWHDDFDVSIVTLLLVFSGKWRHTTFFYFEVVFSTKKSFLLLTFPLFLAFENIFFVSKIIKNMFF